MEDSQLQAERAHLRAILELTNAVTTLDVASLVAAIAPNLQRILAHDDVSLFLHPASEQMASYANTAHGVGWTDDLTAELRPDTEPFATWLAERRTVDIDMEQFDWTGREGIHRNITAAGLKHCCFVPLATSRETLGFLVLNRRSSAPFTPDEMKRSAQAAAQIAIALENALTFREMSSLLKAKAYADAVKAAAERDLRIAREIQMGLLPANVSAQIQGTGLDVYAVLEPARQVGGDLFEVLRLGPDRVLVAVGDVSGKGIPAALFMAVAMTLLRSLARQGNPLQEILRQVNDELLEQNPRGMFVTLQCMVFDLAARSVTCASAGHHAAIRIMPGETPRPIFTSSGRVLALMPADEIVSETLQLEGGETLVLFTDGVSEAFDVNQELFGEERLLAHLQDFPGHTARETTIGVLEAVHRHAAGANQSDDITVVSVRYTGTA